MMMRIWLYFFGRRLLTILPDSNRIIPVSLKDDIAVKYVELGRTFEGSIELPDMGGQVVSTVSTGVTKSKDILVLLSELILRINQEYSGPHIYHCQGQELQRQYVEILTSEAPYMVLAKPIISSNWTA